MTDDSVYGITMGDSSGVGPEIVLNGFRKGKSNIRSWFSVTLACLEHCNDKLGYNVPLRTVNTAGDWKPAS